MENQVIVGIGSVGLPSGREETGWSTCKLCVSCVAIRFGELHSKRRRR